MNPIKCTLAQKENTLNTSLVKILHASGWSLPSFVIPPRGTTPALDFPLHFHSGPRQLKYNPGMESMLVPPGSIL